MPRCPIFARISAVPDQGSDNNNDSSVADIFNEPDADERVVAGAITLAPKRAKKQRGTAAAAKASNQSSFLFG